MRRKILIASILLSTTCMTAVLSGCAEDKKEGPQTIIIELADPIDEKETKETLESMEETSEYAEETSTEASSESETPEQVQNDTQNETLIPEETLNPQIEGLSDSIELSYTQVSSSDPIIGLVIADILPDIHAENVEITNVQAYMDGEEVVPYGDITFHLNVDPESQVVLYRLDEKGKLVSETLEVTDGTVSYQTSDCGRWLVINTVLDATTETTSESVQESEIETSEASETHSQSN